MSDRSITSTISLSERQALLKALSCFSMLVPAESKELASFMFEKQYSPGQIIVNESDLVDSVYIIAAGQAEVTRTIVDKKKASKVVPVATINKGEAIGLNDTGFFSETGQRTATVTALTEMKVLGLSIKDLHQFLQHNAHLKSAMLEAAAQMLRVRLIKQSLPFHQLSHARLNKLATQVEELSVPKGTVIFTQSEEGNCCYLIRSGKVEITSIDENGDDRRLAVLTTPTLFGEATLITHAPRNATAYALEDCELLMLRNEYLSELMESEKNVASMFMTLMVDRSKPLQNPRVTIHTRITPDAQSIVILKNSDNGSYFKLSEQGKYIWEQLNGKQTIQEITLSLVDRFHIFAPDVVAGLISKLAKSGFVSQVEIDVNGNMSNQPLWVRAMLRLRRILEARVAIGDADKWISKFYNKGIRALFTRPGQAILALIAVIGFGAFIFTTTNTIEVFKTMPHSWLLLLCLVPATIIQTILHEFGHAFATKSFGYEVHYMGVGWYWFGPVAFTDTSDMWLSTRGPRTAVNLAGVYTDALVAGICALLIYLIPNAYAQGFLWIFALFTYINAFRMLSPLQELDGYYVLMDLLERPHLRQSAVLWLVKGFPKALRQPSLFKKNLPEVYYWLACIAFLILVSMLTLFLQTLVFKILNIHSSNPFVSLALPFFVVLVSSLTIIADIRSRSD